MLVKERKFLTNIHSKTLIVTAYVQTTNFALLSHTSLFLTKYAEFTTLVKIKIFKRNQMPSLVRLMKHGSFDRNPKTMFTFFAFHSSVTRMASAHGMLRVIKAFSNDSKKKGKRILKKYLEYRIPDFCPCEEIYDNEWFVVIGRNSYFRDDGRKITVVLNSETTIFKYTGKSMRPQIRKITKKFDACNRMAKRRN